ncbi:MAG TPA: hypothetical protein VGF84_02500, partial [Micromonosporaceae bacterium]
LSTLTEQAARLDAVAVEDFTVVNDRHPTDVAIEVIARARWIDPVGRRVRRPVVPSPPGAPG